MTTAQRSLLAVRRATLPLRVTVVEESCRWAASQQPVP
jgi:hypothetical protein